MEFLSFKVSNLSKLKEKTTSHPQILILFYFIFPFKGKQVLEFHQCLILESSQKWRFHLSLVSTGQGQSIVQ